MSCLKQLILKVLNFRKIRSLGGENTDEITLEQVKSAYQRFVPLATVTFVCDVFENNYSKTKMIAILKIIFLDDL